MKTTLVLLALGTIAIAGSTFLVTKWPLIISLFFTTVKIYTALSVFLNHFIS
jgi:hypothetical protein